MIKVCMILKKNDLYWQIIGKAAAPPPPPPLPPPTGGYTASEVINRKTLTDSRCYPCKCHDFVNQFILTIQLYYIFSV
jgi:hypothetical protein